MRTPSRLVFSAAVLSGGLLLAAPVSAEELAPCPYPFDKCPTASPSPSNSPIGGGNENPVTSETPAPGAGGGGGGSTTDNSPVRLPFTGGEVTLIALAGSAALAGGLVLVAAGRRRTTA